MNNTRKELLQALKKYGLKNNIPNISEVSGHFLNFLIKLKKIKNALEIGCANGYSTIWFGDALEQTGGNLLSLDISVPSINDAKKNVINAKLEHIITIELADWKTCLSTLKKEFYDFIFIDAYKKDYKKIWENVKPLLSKDAIIICDDVIKFKEKMLDFYECINNEQKFDYCIIPIDIDDGIMLIQRKLVN